MTHAFILGREPALSTAEILARLKALGIDHERKTAVFRPDFLLIETMTPLPEGFFARLGGSIKHAAVLGETRNPKEDILSALKGIAGGFDFGVSFYGSRKTDLAMDVKTALKERGLSARAVLPKTGDALTSVQVEKNGLTGPKGAEFLVLAHEGRMFLARTLEVQAFEAFSARDYGRPGRDAKSGMLPPKLARMMVNLAAVPDDALLLDPFCGSGTVLTEAVLMGYRELIGTDLSDKAVRDTKENYTWTIKEQGLRGVRFTVMKADVRGLSGKIERGAVDAIVTEPYLGPPQTGRESDQQIHRVYLELMELYKEAFRSFARVLAPGGVVVIAFPVFGKKKHVNILGGLRDMGFIAEGLLPGAAAEALGVRSATALPYRREGQKVGREIFRFRFKGKTPSS